jgi:hypothetical protein
MTAIAIAEETQAKLPLEVGQKMPDGSIFAGFTADGKQQIYAMPQDI